MHLRAAAPCAVAAAAEQVHVVGTKAPVVLRPPHAVGILRLIQEYLTVQRRQLSRGVHVEHQHPAGGHKQMQPPECPLYVLWVRQVVETVQTAHRRVHRTVQVQLRHGLVQEDRRHTRRLPALAHSRRQHILAAVHADDLVTPLRQQPAHGPGAAGQVQHQLHRDTAAAQQLLDEIQPLSIAHILGQRVI